MNDGEFSPHERYAASAKAETDRREGTRWPRRAFLRSLSWGAFGLLGAPRLQRAATTGVGDFRTLIPPEKRLDPAWRTSLFARGSRTLYTRQRNELQYIGMPVGGICCGTLYLGGDGKLWAWDIFNQNQEGILPRDVPWSETGFRFADEKVIRPRDGAAYVKPHRQQSPLEQGFALQVRRQGQSQTRLLDQRGWEDIRFMGQYPIGQVEYRDPGCPVEVQLEAYSPFIPLHAEDSGLPLTVLSYTVANKAGEAVEVSLSGWLQNACSLFHASPGSGSRVNRIQRQEGLTLLACSFECPPHSQPLQDGQRLEGRHDWGTMALAVLNPRAQARADAAGDAAAGYFAGPGHEGETARKAVPEPCIGALTESFALAAGEERTITFLIAWHFPHSSLAVNDARGGNRYSRRFADAAEVAAYARRHFARLSETTRLWRDTWYDSTLPFWFLDRSFANTSILATSTCHRFANGRFWAWEGVGACPGTCTHVWHYAQAMGRIFPELERDVRERVDFGIGFQEDQGIIGHRGEHSGPAVDGQAGRILGALREHQMSEDGAFLRRLWPRIRKATEFLMDHDHDGDGILDGAQENTLDAAWYGKISWINSLYLAALRAAEEMARETGDLAFARLCRERHRQARAAHEEQLFQGEYFIQLPEPGREGHLGTYQGCHIDQVLGQGWAWQVGLGRILDPAKTLSALRALYRYNFTLDVGPFREANPVGRPYALAGEGGLIMATNPHGRERPFGHAAAWQYGYFNECMSGFEHQCAAHMIAEGLVEEGLAVTRAIHDRYHAAKRNPWNEIECSDHYARAMASYGTFISLCGFAYHGPEGRIAFDPRLQPEHFRAPFTTAAGWGTFAQKNGENGWEAQLTLKYGSLALKTIRLPWIDAGTRAFAGDRPLPAHAGRGELILERPVRLSAGGAALRIR